MSQENTKTEIVETETVFLGREHVRFLEETINKIQKASSYKTSKSQLIRLLIECSMERAIHYDGITNEAISQRSF